MPLTDYFNLLSQCSPLPLSVNCELENKPNWNWSKFQIAVAVNMWEYKMSLHMTLEKLLYTPRVKTKFIIEPKGDIHGNRQNAAGDRHRP